MNQTMSESAETTPLTEDEVAGVLDGKYRSYAFVEASYKDIFLQQHHMKVCAFYDIASKKMALCSTQNTDN